MGFPMRTRVIQWATGPVGAAQLREIIDDPELELAGVFVYSPEKVGMDAGTLVGRPPTGVIATNDKRAILALEGQTVRVSVEGVPNMTLELVVDTKPVPELGDVSGGYVAVAMSAIRAIPYVLEVPPGVVLPQIFGAYRWRSRRSLHNGSASHV